MKESQYVRGGRCTDLDKLMRLALMSIGIPVTASRIIAWPWTDSNHEILTFDIFGEQFDLDAIVTTTRHPDYLTSHIRHVGKVYEEDWGNWTKASSITRGLKEGEALPWHIRFYLGTRSMTDNTARFTSVFPVSARGIDAGSLAYLGVMNNSSDIANLGIAAIAAERSDFWGRVTFPDIGEGNLYFVHTYSEPQGNPAGEIRAALILHKGGRIEELAEESTWKKVRDYTLHRKGLAIPGEKYELVQLKDREWKPKYTVIADLSDSVSVGRLQDNVLYALRHGHGENTRFTRPFIPRKDTVEFY